MKNQQKLIFSYSRIINSFIIIFPILFLIFSSEIWLPHAPHDNTRYFSKEEYNKIISQCEADSQYIWLNYINRPVAARIECLTFNLTKNLYSFLVVLSEIN